MAVTHPSGSLLIDGGLVDHGQLVIVLMVVVVVMLMIGHGVHDYGTFHGV